MFNRIFDRDDISHFNLYEIKMRKYYKTLPNIARDINYIINKYEDFAIMLLNARVTIHSYEDNNMTEDEFIKSIEYIYRSEEILKIIEEYIESTYDISLDESNGNKKINTDLQVTDHINKLILRSSVMIRLFIPIICDYVSLNCQNNERIFIRVFKEIIKITSGDKDIVLNKLNKIVKSRVFQTRYSDTVMWTYLKNMAVDMDTLTIEIYNNIIKTIFCKIEPNTSSIKFLDVVIRNKIEFKFTYNYPISFKSIKIDQNDDNDLDEKDKFEIMLFSSENNEGDICTQVCSVKQICDRYSKDFDEASINEFKEKILKNKIVNEIQKYFLQLYFYKYFNIEYSSEKQRVILLMALIKELNKKGFKTVSLLLNSQIDKNNIYVSNNKRVSIKVLESNEYKKLSRKFLSVLNIFMKDNIIGKLISFKNYKFVNEDNESVEFDLDQYLFECIKFLNVL